jgi:hypothetical protein
MALLRILPFTTISDFESDGLKLDVWKLDDRDLAQVTIAQLSNFDPVLDQEFERFIEIDPAVVAREALQGKKAEFMLLVEVRSSHTGMRSTYEVCRFGATSKKFGEQISIVIENRESGGRLHFLTRIVVTKPDPIEETSASASGSVIFQDVMQFDAEAYFDGFPHLEPAKLNGYLNLTPGPVWVVEVDAAHLDVHATQAVTVSVNAETSLGQGLLNGKKELFPVRAAIMVDICRQLVNAALDSVDFETAVALNGSKAFSATPNSIGAMMYSTLILCGFHEPPSECRAMREVRPLEFDARIHNHVYSVAGL